MNRGSFLITGNETDGAEDKRTTTGTSSSSTSTPEHRVSLVFTNDIVVDNLERNQHTEEEVEIRIHSMLHSLEHGQSMEQIQSITCKNNVLTDQALSMMQDFFHKNDSRLRLQAIHIINNLSLTLASSPTLAKIVGYQLSSLVDLDLSHNPSIFGGTNGQGLECLLRALLDHTTTTTKISGSSGCCCRIQKLNLSHNSIGRNGKSVQHISRLLCNNHSIQHLNISYNYLTQKHMSKDKTNGGLYNNSTLLTLELSNNGIGNQGMNRIFDAIDQHRGSKTILQELNLSKNGITCLREGNSIVSVLRDNRNKSLRSLNLSNNSIKSDSAESIREVLMFNYTLVHVDLSSTCHHDLDVIEAIAGSLYTAEYTIPNLIQINLSSNMISDDGAISIAEMIRNNQRLEYIDLSHNMIQNNGMQAIIRALPHHVAIKELLLHNNRFNDDNILSEYICNIDLFKLHSFTYQNEHFQPHQIDNIESAFRFHRHRKSCLKSILSNIQRRTVRSIRIVSSRGKQYGDKELQAITNQFVLCPIEIRSAYLESSKITDAGITHFCKNVLCSHDQRLSVARLYCSDLIHLTSIGISTIGRCLEHPTCQLRVLSLYNCNIGPESAISLAQSLELNESLTLINLQCNPMSDRGAKAIFHSLFNPPHRNLRILNMSETQLTDDALAGIGPFVQLSDILLDKNDISDVGVMDLCKAVINTSSIQYLSLCYNPKITQRGIQTLHLHLPNRFVLESDLLYQYN